MFHQPFANLIRHAVGAICAAVCLALVATAISGGVSAQTGAPSALQSAGSLEGKTLKVGAVVSPPFVIQFDNGRFRGLAYELWREVAETAKIDFAVVTYETEEAALQAVAQGRIDVAIGDIGIRREQEDVVDFLHPFLHSNVAIATLGRKDASLFGALGRLVSGAALEVVLTMIGILVLLTAAIWFFERRNNEELFGDRNRDFVSGLIWTSLIATALEGDIFKMRSKAARVLGLVLLLVGTTVVASWIALITSALTVDSLTPKVASAAQLQGARIGVERDSEGMGYLVRQGLPHTTYEHTGEALKALLANRLDAVVAHRADMNWLISRMNRKEIFVLPDVIDSEYAAFAIPQASPLREPLNRAMLDILESDTWIEILAHYGVQR
jgi:polar amino acid transport system substrate-binding protein